jgi:predicted metalloprotease
MVEWRSGRRSTNVDDRRGQRPRRMGTPAAVGGLGGVGLLVALAILLLGGDPTALLETTGGQPGGAESLAGRSAEPTPVADDEEAQFISRRGR